MDIPLNVRELCMFPIYVFDITKTLFLIGENKMFKILLGFTLLGFLDLFLILKIFYNAYEWHFKFHCLCNKLISS